MKSLLICFILSFLSGCGVLANQAAAEHDEGHPQSGGAITYTTADVRTIMRRTRPKTGEIPEVVCTEPTPDVAKALSSAFSASAKGNSGSVGGDLSLSQSTAQALAELGGRSTALLALRDGLFRTCEAYANGSIGSAAYALVLSRYGQLMTTLFLAENIRGATRDGQATVKSPATTPPAANPNTTPASASTDNTTAGHGTVPALGPAGSGGDVDGSYMKVAAASPGSPHAAAPGAGGSPAGGTPGSTPGAVTPPPPTAEPASVTSAPTASSTAVLALARMNEDYFALDVDLLPQLLVACINEFDPTVGSTRGENTWVRTACNNLNSGDTLKTLLHDRVSLLRPVAPQVDPSPSSSGTPHASQPQAAASGSTDSSAPARGAAAAAASSAGADGAS